MKLFGHFGGVAHALTLIGFGEAAEAFATGAGWGIAARAFDIKTDDEATRPDKVADYARCGVLGGENAATALANASLILSLVTADKALAAAQGVAAHISPRALYCDMNSVAPVTKRAAADAISAAGGRYVDIAVMAPVYPGQCATPLLASGPYADAAADALRSAGFSNVRIIEGDIGAASSVKMIRSVVIKGIEALTAESLVAAHRAGVVEEVLASLGGDWAERADYNLDRMLVHGTRRAAEMHEVAKTLEALGVEPVMTRGTIRRQAEIGAIGGGSPEGLTAKLRIAA